MAQWSLSTLRDRLVKIGAKIVRHGRSIMFQMAEVMVSRGLFQQILDAIAALRPLGAGAMLRKIAMPGQPGRWQGTCVLTQAYRSKFSSNSYWPSIGEACSVVPTMTTLQSAWDGSYIACQMAG